MNTYAKQMIDTLLVIVLAMFVVPAISANAPVAQIEKIPTGLWQAFSTAQHLIQPEPDKDGTVRFKGQNPGNRFNFTFDPKGVTYHSNSKKHSWQLSMELTAYGTTEVLRPLPAHKLLLDDNNRVIYDRGVVHEWYVNNEAGLEQGFTLQTRPYLAKPHQEIVLNIKLSGNLIPRWQKPGQSVGFYTASGVYAFNYAKLSVIDSEGKHLPAQMALVDDALQLKFNPENAKWPIIVDPLTYTETKLIGADNDAEDNAQFGISVAIEGNNAVIGAFLDDSSCSGTDVNCGAAYVFTYTNNSWFLQQKLGAEDPDLHDNFGGSVALHGETVLVGAINDDGSCSGSEVNCGAAYVFTRQANTWSQQQKLAAEVPDGVGDFGFSVALDNDTALIGAFRDDSSCSGADIECGAAYVFNRSGNFWTQQQKLTAIDPVQRDFFGYSVALDVDTALVGIYRDSSTCTEVDTNCGAVYVFIQTDNIWTQQQILAAEDPDAGDSFGYSVALEGDTALIGAQQESGSCSGPGATCGAAYVFTRADTTWSQLQKLITDDPNSGDRFGDTVTLDGDTALIGAKSDDGACSGNGVDCGAAYVFARDNNIWSQQQKLVSNTPVSRGFFGNSVALSGDIALVGYSSDDSSCRGTDSNCGVVYGFMRSGNIWSEQQIITASSVDKLDNFGNSVALDGDTALIGAYSDSNSCTGLDILCGATYVFSRSGNTWIQQQTLTAEDPDEGDYFGFSVALDSNTVLIGANFDDDTCTGANTDCGAAYVFTRSGDIWSQQQKLAASDASASNWFGGSVSLDGDSLVVGASGNDSTCTTGGEVDCGAAYVFTRFGNTWSQQQKISASDPKQSDWFGVPVTILENTVLAGASGADSSCTDELAIDCGAAYIFTLTGNTWSQQQKLFANEPNANDSFGFSVALNNETALIGAHKVNSGCTGGEQCGAAYIFTRSGNSWFQQQKLMAPDADEDDNFRTPDPIT